MPERRLRYLVRLREKPAEKMTPRSNPMARPTAMLLRDTPSAAPMATPIARPPPMSFVLWVTILICFFQWRTCDRNRDRKPPNDRVDAAPRLFHPSAFILAVHASADRVQRPVGRRVLAMSFLQLTDMCGNELPSPLLFHPQMSGLKLIAILLSPSLALPR